MDLASIERPLRQLRKQLKAVDRDLAPKDVHKLRTRAHRVQAIAAIGPEPPRHLLRCVDAIRKSAGKVRDLDAMRTHALTLAGESSPGSLPRLLRHMVKLRARAAAQLSKTLDRHGDRLRGDLADYAHRLAAAFPSPGAAASSAAPHRQNVQQLRRAVARLLREICLWPELGESNLHDLRIKLKRVCIFSQLLPDQDTAWLASLKGAITQIGEWHDWRHLATVAHETLDTVHDAPLLAKIDAAAASRLTHAIASARSLRKQPPAKAAPPRVEPCAASSHRAA